MQLGLLTIVLIAISSILFAGIFELTFTTKLKQFLANIEQNWSKSNTVTGPTSVPRSDLSHILKTIQNITSESTKRIKELESKGGYTDTFNRLITTVSHQLRTPVTGLKWALGNIKEDISQNKIPDKELVTGAYDATDRIGNIIEDMIMGIRHENSAKKNIKPFDVENIINKIVVESLLIAKQKQVDLQVFKTSTQIPLIEMDEQEFGFIIHSILSNAIYYSESKKPVSINLSHTEQKVNIAIKNYGLTIPEKEQKMLFSQFNRGSEAIKMNPDGSGMSLYIVKQIVIDVGGDISFTSDGTNGTIFTINFPISKTGQLENFIHF
jgi:signal transduction histidine kinase